MTALLLLGNGLSIDFSSTLKQEDRLDSSSPLSMQFPIHAFRGIDAQSHLKELSAAVAYTREVWPDKKDYDRIEILNDLSRAGGMLPGLYQRMVSSGGHWLYNLTQTPFGTQTDRAQLLLKHQLKLYLCAAFTHVSKNYSSFVSNQWSWNQWLQRNHSKVAAALSLNYDVIFEENFCRTTGRPISYALGHGDLGNGLPVVKPHGSVNFRVPEVAISIGGRSIYEYYGIFHRSNTPVVVKSIFDPALMPDVVLPVEYSDMDHFQWIASGYRFLDSIYQDIDQCIIAGI